MSASYTLDIQTDDPYRVLIGTFLLEEAGTQARTLCPDAVRALIITDSNVGPLYAEPVSRSLGKSGLDVRIATFEAGEAHKTIDTFSSLLERCAEAGLTRTDLIVALGGGVVGDMAGFVAASYMRGIPYIQIPTSLLAMVDSSVGGKTAIDLTCGKNLAGAFWQPKAVLADVGCLGTLDDAHIADGCGEMVKHAVIADAELFAEMEKTPLTPELVKSDLARAAYLIARNVDIKRAVVVSDEREAGMRKVLNLGHSIGHGVEVAEGFALGHGTCVGIGMVAIASAAVTAGVCPEGVPERIAALLRAHGLSLDTDAEPERVYAEALHDKKRTSDSIDLIIPREIGSVSIVPTSLEEFRRILEVGLACTTALAHPNDCESEAC